MGSSEPTTATTIAWLRYTLPETDTRGGFPQGFYLI